jgi:hypothetical protein
MKAEFTHPLSRGGLVNCEEAYNDKDWPAARCIKLVNSISKRLDELIQANRERTLSMMPQACACESEETK